jgi:hypothetical protein
LSYVEVVEFFWIQSIPNFFGLPFTSALNGRHNIRIVKDSSIKFLTVRFVLYLNKKTTKKSEKKKKKRKRKRKVLSNPTSMRKEKLNRNRENDNSMFLVQKPTGLSL